MSPSRTCAPASGRAAGGFTLLEVLAAVALLGFVYATLGATGIQGLQHEGEARRRIEASLLADRVLAELEASLDRGEPPEPGREEREEGDFRIEVEVAPWALVLPEESERGNRIGRQRSRLQGDAAAPQPVAGASLLDGSGGARNAAPLRRIDVRVAWDEGFGERAVLRTTFALDRVAAASTLEAIAAAAAPTGADASNPLGGEGGADAPAGEVP